MTTAEHSYLAQQIDVALRSASEVALMGVVESDRRRFDYSVTCLRDLSRPLVAQVLWTHVDGVEKDLRTLLHEPDARIKLYVVRDGLRVRQRIDEVVTSYRRMPDLLPLLRGLRILFVPPDFDADRLGDQAWMATFLRNTISRDVLFNIVFGNLDAQTFAVFSDHGGPLGLKYAVLDEITRNGLDHTPTFTARLGYRTSGPIREAIAMLNASGLIRRLEGSVCCLPTAKGRALLDFSRLMLFESSTRGEWSTEAAMMLSMLGVPTDRFYPNATVTTEAALSDRRVAGLLLSAQLSKRMFGHDLLADVDPAAPRFYSEVDCARFSDLDGRKQTMEDIIGDV
jgi:hypothetical protein